VSVNSILKKDRENLFEVESREWVYSCVNVSLACNDYCLYGEGAVKSNGNKR
jgi:hypothetical protein